jgi:hypothetical protein
VDLEAMRNEIGEIPSFWDYYNAFLSPLKKNLKAIAMVE